MIACRLGNIDLINFLIDNGADLNMEDGDSKTASHYAVFAHRCDVVDLMVSKGANINSGDHFGNTPLHCAVEKNCEDVVKVILKTRVKEMNKANNNGGTPLHLACIKGHKHIVGHLLKCSPDVNLGDITGFTPLHEVCNEGNAEIVQLLLKLPNIDVNRADKDGNSPLHYAAYRGHIDTVPLLLQQPRINLNMVNITGNTPLHMAVQKQHYNVVALMLSQGNVEMNMKNSDKLTPLLQAISGGHFGMIHNLLSHGADINAVDNNDNNCLHLAVRKEAFHSEDESLGGILDEYCTKLELSLEDKLSGLVVAEYLAYHGANFYHENKQNQTPMELIENAGLREKMQTFFPPPLPCKWCEENKPTITFRPCGHVVLCEECCSKIPLKRCPECLLSITGKYGVDGSQCDAESIYTCTICMEQRWNMVFECGHTTCKECGNQLDRCHLCRKRIERKIIIKQC
ncbi:E3 ubiquitin-protein ligase MIB2 isoform X2 [Octopus sinensis]|nr:E3 ubiquitin-protein ligase MIB2 isoform X2 [Octopus sinensis]